MAACNLRENTFTWCIRFLCVLERSTLDWIIFSSQPRYWAFILLLFTAPCFSYTPSSSCGMDFLAIKINIQSNQKPYYNFLATSSRCMIKNKFWQKSFGTCMRLPQERKKPCFFFILIAFVRIYTTFKTKHG